MRSTMTVAARLGVGWAGYALYADDRSNGEKTLPYLLIPHHCGMVRRPVRSEAAIDAEGFIEPTGIPETTSLFAP
jgi:hypothetical protein